MQHERTIKAISEILETVESLISQKHQQKLSLAPGKWRTGYDRRQRDNEILAKVHIARIYLGRLSSEIEDAIEEENE